MRGLLNFLPVILLPALVMGQTPTATKSTAGVPAAASTGGAGMTEEQKTLYALGLNISKSIGPFNLTPAELELVKKGLSDGLAGKPAVSMETYGPKLQPLYEARTKAAGAAFLAKAAAQPGAVKTASGLVYQDERAGAGPRRPRRPTRCRNNYRGTLIDGTEFDSSYKTNRPFPTLLTNVIPCWTEGVQKMKVGGKAKLTCPYNLAYGDRGAQGIPGFATLVFEVELLSIDPPGAAGAAK